MDHRDERQRYWRANLFIVGGLLSIWFVVSYVVGIMSAASLNQDGGQPWGFWIAQQGNILVFVVLILVYCLLMDREDKKYHVDEQSSDDSQEGTSVSSIADSMASSVDSAQDSPEKGDSA